MLLRKNALLGAARMIEAIDRVAMGIRRGVGTVGLLENRPKAAMSCRAKSFFTVDLRHPDEAVLE